ncbi:hypothetical protein HI914_01525 [Erysiphe necator]|nr:hypothetical protein HI914_01525 [Erysiphe necator]
MGSNVMKCLAFRATLWRPSGIRNLVQNTRRGLADASQPLLSGKPVGAFRGGFTTSAGVYYYVLEDYKISNQLLNDDINTLQTSIQRVHKYIQSLEQKLLELEKKCNV